MTLPLVQRPEPSRRTSPLDSPFFLTCTIVMMLALIAVTVLLTRSGWPLSGGSLPPLTATATPTVLH